RWPAIPQSLKWPTDDFPADLLRTLEKPDPAAFGKAFRKWLDSGVLRDRQTIAALETRVLTDSQVPLFLKSADLLDSDISAKQRMRVIALITVRWHYERFAAERRNAIKLVSGPTADPEFVRRAAFWELGDGNVHSVKATALEALEKSEAGESQRV